MKKIKVVYFIYSGKNSSGGGGHFYSLDTIETSLSHYVNSEIINFGYGKSDALKDKENYTFIHLSKWQLFLKVKKILKKIRIYDADIIHAFDTRSLFIARTIALFYNVKIVFNKCGGANGNPYFISEADAQILFSKENFDFYNLHSNRKIPKFLIPNRISEIESKKSRLNKFKKRFCIGDELIVMRISRFNPYYNLTFWQTINLFKKIHQEAPNSRLLFIGTIQSPEYFEHFKNMVDKEHLPIDFIIDKEFTANAKQFIELADIVVATGRGVMEACALNKRVFCPIQNSDLPLELGKNTFEFLFSTNFSERASLKNKKRFGGDFEIMLKSNKNVNTKFFFDEYFCIENVSSKYLEIYNSVKKTRFNIINYLANFIRFIK